MNHAIYGVEWQPLSVCASDFNGDGRTDIAVTGAYLNRFSVLRNRLAPTVCCAGTTGNVNVSGSVDLADLSALVTYLTGGGYSLPCKGEANVSGSGSVDLADLSALVSYLTGGGYVLPSCP
jgi:hypothetical protein